MIQQSILAGTFLSASSCDTNTNDYPTTNVAYYKMSSAADEKDTYNGTATNVNFNVQGKYGNAAEFNGSNSVIDLPDPLNITTDFTLSGWVSAISGAAITYLYSSTDTNNDIIYFNFAVQPSQNRFFVLYDGVAYYTNLTYESGWHHYAITFNGTSLKVYRNGSLLATHSISTVASISGSKQTIGARVRQNYNDFGTGSVDQVRIFSSALDATQVASLYNEVYCVPTIVPTAHFEPVIYSGNNTAKTVSVGFAPDLVWIKNRNNSSNSTHANTLFDSVRTSGYRLVSNTTAAENDYSSHMSGFTSGGFNLTTSGALNDGGGSGTYVAWNWKAGGAAVSNTDGTRTSQVSANVDAGFSILTLDKPNTNTDTYGHGLSEAPELIILKRTASADDWYVYSKELGNTVRISLNSSAAKATGTGVWGSTTPTSSVFTLQNQLGGAHVAYAFHSVDGYSKMGSYTGTGATGNTIVTGFRPAFVMIKSTGVESWYMMDNKRLNGVYSDQLYANLSNAEGTGQHVDFTSNGFQLDTTDGGVNNGSASYIFMAFAEDGLPYVTRNATNPFGDSSELALYKFEDNATNSEDNVTASSTSVTYASGYIDKAAVFNGSSSYVNLNSAVLPASVFSVSLWINLNSLSTGWLFTQYTGSVTGRFVFNVTSTGGFQINVSSANSLSTTDIPVITTGNWHHVVVVKDGSNGWTLYADGQPHSTWNNTANIITNQNTILGGDDVVTSPNMVGKIDQVRIFNRALDSGEVTALYNE